MPDDNVPVQDPVKVALFKALGHMVQTPPVDPNAPPVVEAPDSPIIPKPVFDEESFKGSEGSVRDKLKYMRAQAAAPAPPPEEPVLVEPVVVPPVDDKVVVKRPTVVAPAAPIAPVPEPPPVKPTLPELPSELSEEEQEEIELAKFAEASDPAKYAGYTKRVVSFIKQHREFVARQQEANPDLELETNTEYQTFVERNKVLQTAERKKLGRAKLIDEARQIAKEEAAPEIEALRLKIREIEIRPQIKATVDQLRSEATTLIDHAAAKAIKEKGREAAAAEYALESGVIQEYVDLAANAASEFLAITQGLVKPDPKNQTHVWLFEFIKEQTELFEKMGGDARIRDGKQFVSRIKYSQMSESDRAKHFTLSDTEVLQLIALSAKYGAEQKLRAEQDRIEKAGYVKKTAAPVPAPPVAKPGDTPPPRAHMAPSPGSSQSTPLKKDAFLTSLGIS